MTGGAKRVIVLGDWIFMLDGARLDEAVNFISVSSIGSVGFNMFSNEI